MARMWDSSVPLKDRSRVPLRREVCGEKDRGQRPQLQLLTFRGEDRFWIGAGNLADGDPPEPADQRAN